MSETGNKVTASSSGLFSGTDRISRANQQQQQSTQWLSRVKRELSILQSSPAPGVECWLAENEEDRMDRLYAHIAILPASIESSSPSPYEGGLFDLSLVIPPRFPFEPPQINFQTPIYHPNIDEHGRICLDVLKLPPAGSWKPSFSIYAVLMAIQCLMNEPNPDDPLRAEIAQEFRSSYGTYFEKARALTMLHAFPKSEFGSTASQKDRVEETALSGKSVSPYMKEAESRLSPAIGEKENVNLSKRNSSPPRVNESSAKLVVTDTKLVSNPGYSVPSTLDDNPDSTEAKPEPSSVFARQMSSFSMKLSKKHRKK